MAKDNQSSNIRYLLGRSGADNPNLLEAAQAFRLAFMVLVSKAEADPQIESFLSENTDYLDQCEQVIEQWSARSAD